VLMHPNACAAEALSTSISRTSSPRARVHAVTFAPGHMRTVACRCAGARCGQATPGAGAFPGSAIDVCFTCLDVRDALITLPSHTPSLAVPALARSASTLTSLQGLPISGLLTRADTGLTAFTQLRVLTLCQTEGFVTGGLRAEYLPANLEDVTLRLALDYYIIDIASSDEDTYEEARGIRALPSFDGFDSLCRLRRITLSRYDAWHLGSWDEEERELLPVQLPTSLAVR